MPLIPEDKVAPWRLIGTNVPKVEIYGPYSNQYKVFIEDLDGDIIALLPVEAKRLIKRLEKALMTIADRRKMASTKHKKVVNL